MTKAEDHVPEFARGSPRSTEICDAKSRDLKPFVRHSPAGRVCKSP